jgi:glutamate dehydrogenase (NAD(P)+)
MRIRNLYKYYDSKPYKIVHWVDPKNTGAEGWVVIDRLINGVAGGGLFMHKNASLGEVIDLSRGMTFKNSLQKIPFGGGKGGIKFDHKNNSAHRVLERFLEFNKELIEEIWCTGADLNTTNDQITKIIKNLGLSSPFVSLAKMIEQKANIKVDFEVFHQALSISSNEFFKISDSITGYGVASTISFLTKNLNEKPKIVIQGFGKVGSSLAYYLQKNDIAKIVGLCDKEECLINPQGIDIEKILATRGNSIFGIHDSYKYYRNNLSDSEFLQWFLSSVKADIFSPCATRYIINEDVLSTLNNVTFQNTPNKFIVSGANKVFSNADLIKNTLECDIIIVPEWVSNCGNALLFLESLTQTKLEQNWSNKIKNIVTDRIYRFLQSSKEEAQKYNVSLYESCYEVAMNKINN